MSVSEPTEHPEVYGLVRKIRKAIGRDDYASAERHCLALLELRPQHEQALGFLASRALGAGDAARARALAERGLTASPGSAALVFQLGCALEAQREHEAAARAFTRAQEIDPEFLVALIFRGAQDEALGRTDEALRTYTVTLEQAQRSGLLAQRAQLPPEFNRRIDHAIDVVQGARARAVAEALAPIAARHGEAAVARMRRAVDIQVGREQYTDRHPLQRPTFLLIPDMPKQPWFEREQFPFFARIEAATDAIRAELLSVLADEIGMQPYVQMADDAPAAPIWRELNRSPRWSGFHLFRHGQKIEENCRRCPNTVAALESIPIMRIPEHSPESMFSVLRPKTHIPPHTGVMNGRLTVHLPLIVPEDCGRMVAGREPRPWIEGQCLVFDDSFVHEAWNDSEHTRVVLIFDVWNPHLTEAEREAVSDGIVAIGRFNRRYGGTDPSVE